MRKKIYTYFVQLPVGIGSIFGGFYGMNQGLYEMKKHHYNLEYSIMNGMACTFIYTGLGMSMGGFWFISVPSIVYTLINYRETNKNNY